MGVVTLFLVCQLPDFCLRFAETTSQLFGWKVNWSSFSTHYVNTVDDNDWVKKCMEY